MSCAELMYHQNLSSGFPYHQRSISDVYYGGYNPSGVSYNDHNAAATVGSGDSRMLQSLSGETSPSGSLLHASAVPPPPLSTPNAPGTVLPTDFSSSSTSLSSSGLPRPLHLSSSSVSPQGHVSSRISATAAPSTPSSSPSLSSPPASTLSPTLPFFPASVSTSSSPSSAFISRPPPQDLSPAGAFHTAPQSASFFFPPSQQQNYSSSYSSSLKRSSEITDDPDDTTVPKKTRYVTSNCVMLTYHDKETSSEVDEHFSKALSASSPCRYGSSGSGDDSTGTPMAQRNFPPSFWDANHNQHNLYSAYNAYALPHPSGSQASYLGHDALYSGLSGGWLGASGALQYPLSSLQPKDPWSAFPFASSSGSSKSSSLNPYYPYARAMAGYPDQHSFSSGYGAGVGSSRFSSNFLFPSSSSSNSSPRSGHFPSATITSAAAAAAAHCANADPIGLRMSSLTGELSRNPFATGSGSVAGQF